MIAEEPILQSAELEIRCDECGASLVVKDSSLTARCPYCASTSLVEHALSADRPRPEFIIPFVWGMDRVRQKLRRWIGSSGLFVPSAFKAAALEELHGIYVPAWLYGAVGSADYSVSIGEDYQRVETYTTTDSKGRTVIRTRVRTYTEWRSLSGRYESWLMDLMVSASRGLVNADLESVEPFDLRAMKRYDPRLLAGWSAEGASLELDSCLAEARHEAEARLGQELSGFMPGDSYVDLSYSSEFSEETSSLVLLPVWIGVARYGSKGEQVRVLLNGQTGEVVGSVPKSWTKILLFAFGVLFALLALYSLSAGLLDGALR
ncbi:MAG: hypothetical protein OSB14_08675 [Planctomycetota bacterium]|nr:hypothetical protein [Planctomycetota bacterium]